MGPNIFSFSEEEKYFNFLSIEIIDYEYQLNLMIIYQTFFVDILKTQAIIIFDIFLDFFSYKILMCIFIFK